MSSQVDSGNLLTEDEFVIKTDKGYWIYIVFSFLGLSIVPVLCLADAMYLAGILLLLICAFFIIRWCVAVFRTVVFSKAGITIKFLWRKKELSWNEVNVSLEFYGNSLLQSRNTELEAAVFTSKTARFKKPRRWQPLIFNILVRPFSFVYVYFAECANYVGPHAYPAKKQIFVEKLTAWNVL